MALLPHPNTLFAAAKCYAKSCNILTVSVRHLMSKQLVYSQFGDPLSVLKVRESEVPPLGRQDILVRMLAAPINPADINTIQGNNIYLPKLPTIPGDEGVGDIVETGELVSRVAVGQRVVLSKRLLGSWRSYGIYNERDVHVISKNTRIPEACMLTTAPSSAYRMIHDFRKLKPGDTIIQNAANSPCGQSVIQLCKTRGINTINIVANQYNYASVKTYLLQIGASVVYTLEEAEALSFNTSLARPKLALNCLGGRYEDVLLKLLDRKGVIVYYGMAYYLPFVKMAFRCDVEFNKFHILDWEAKTTNVVKDVMYKHIIEEIMTGEFRAPVYEPIELKDYVHALKNTEPCEAFSTISYVFDFTLPY